MGQASSQAAPGPLGRSQGCPLDQDYGVACEQSLNTQVNCPEPQVWGLAKGQGDPGEARPSRHRDPLQGRATPVIPTSRNFVGPPLLVPGEGGIQVLMGSRTLRDLGAPRFPPTHGSQDHQLLHFSLCCLLLTLHNQLPRVPGGIPPPQQAAPPPPGPVKPAMVLASTVASSPGHLSTFCGFGTHFHKLASQI